MAASKSAFRRRVEEQGLVLGDEVAGGGQGTVYSATDAAGNLVAVKRLRNLERGWRFTAEIAAMQRLVADGCDSVPPVLGYVVDDSNAFYWMPFYEQGSLQRRLDTRTTANPLVLSRALVAAVESIHARGVSHRDLKPDNVLFDDGRVVLADFGLCLDEASDLERRTASGEQIGARFYMAPEMRDGGLPTPDHRPADLYSLAKILWCLLAGESRPFDREARHFEPANLPSARTGMQHLVPVENRLRTWMDPDPYRRSSVSHEDMLDAIETAAAPIPPPSSMGAKAHVLEGLSRAAVARRIEIARQQQLDAESRVTRHAELTRRLEAWLRDVQQHIIAQIHQSSLWATWCAYGDASRDYLRLTGGTDGATAPVAGYINLLTGEWARDPRTTSGTELGGGYYRDSELWGVSVDDGVNERRQFTLKASMGTEELLLYACEFQTGRDPRGFASSRLPIVESVKPLHESSVHRAGELAVVVMQSAIDYIESLPAVAGPGSADPNPG